MSFPNHETEEVILTVCNTQDIYKEIMPCFNLELNNMKDIIWYVEAAINGKERSLSSSQLRCFDHIELDRVDWVYVAECLCKRFADTHKD